MPGELDKVTDEKRRVEKANKARKELGDSPSMTI